ncbi:hypothetical protein P8452_69137 [Trifolium repens]|nr:hypothetical protein P8452_69137 [Trifolium repens]
MIPLIIDWITCAPRLNLSSLKCFHFRILIGSYVHMHGHNYQPYMHQPKSKLPSIFSGFTISLHPHRAVLLGVLQVNTSFLACIHFQRIVNDIVINNSLRSKSASGAFCIFEFGSILCFKLHEEVLLVSQAIALGSF